MTNTVTTLVSNVALVVVLLVAKLAMDWRLTLLSFVVFPVFFVPLHRFGRTLCQVTRSQMEQNAAMRAQLTATLGVSGVLLVKLLGRQQDELWVFPCPCCPLCW